MGGFALGLWGFGRATSDIDFLAHRDDMGEVNEIMVRLGYECLFKSENVSQYLSPLKVFGEIDFIHAFRQPSLEMLERAEMKPIFNGELQIRVLKPDDLIVFKLQAIKKDLKTMAGCSRNPFMKNGEADVDAYIEFVCDYNEFINHEPKPFRKIIDREMIL